ncbi:hypothetical protein GS399_08070 [Pedobacter sp. HMF7647]|uniref:Lipoprotein n=1 Tax=Hufsiella arboris TaxID=2695275 RepID=A0A7K1YA32_9SPHI|nr:hypothetical protein [Hufsiella arboris]MXV50928.1 hypothetical protein [Hufsiella arboris]
MRFFKILLSIIVFSALFNACKKDASQNKLIDSYSKFKEFKKSTDDNYSYTVISGSWTGIATETTITVMYGTVRMRECSLFAIDGGTGVKVLKESWVEDVKTLGTHKSGAEALTLDQVYEKAGNVWLKANTKENDIYFETANNGMISNCGYVPKNCIDDCFVGINISNISQVSVIGVK